MQRMMTALAILSAAGLCVAAGAGQEKTAAMTAVSYDQLKQEVLKHRGKVLVIDFWAGY